MILAFVCACSGVNATENNDDAFPIGKPGLKLTYRSKANEIPGSHVRKFELLLGSVEEHKGRLGQWFELNAEKENKQMPER